MKKVSHETRVGLFVLGTLVVAGIFAWALGAHNPLKQTVDFYITYNFAGGIDIGSPVRVSGIKVGKVERIDFFTPSEGANSGQQEPGSDPYQSGKAIVPLKVKVSIRKEAAYGVRQDSHFYINLAGIIGERYIEITPGSKSAAQVAQGSTVVGVDPPRIDQLLSQSFDLAGKITDIIEENKGDLTKSLELIYKLSGNLNKTLSAIDKSAMFKSDIGQLMQNMTALSSDLRKITHTLDGKLHSSDGEKTLQLLHELIWRLEPLKTNEIRHFFQQEGVKVKMF